MTSWSGVAGLREVRSPDSSSLKVSCWPGRMMSPLAVRECLVALREEAARPASVLGPVESCALERLAANCFSVAMAVLSFAFVKWKKRPGGGESALALYL